jgi:hypothetical protein
MDSIKSTSNFPGLMICFFIFSVSLLNVIQNRYFIIFQIHNENSKKIATSDAALLFRWLLPEDSSREEAPLILTWPLIHRSQTLLYTFLETSSSLTIVH